MVWMSKYEVSELREQCLKARENLIAGKIESRMKEREGMVTVGEFENYQKEIKRQRIPRSMGGLQKERPENLSMQLSCGMERQIWSDVRV